MLKALTLLLLCVLLPTCQGGAEGLLSVAQVDKSVLENALSNVMAKGDLLQGLTGGVGKNVLGGLSGGQNGGLLNGVLGGQDGGLLGGVLGGQGGGPLDGVLGGQDGGLLGGVLGGQGGGPLDGVLGGQGGGPLDGVLGGQGGGLLSGVLGGQGGGPLDGVLGGQDGGLLGGVLGGQGGGLFGGLLRGQNGGLLGGVLGREGLLGLKLVDIVLPKVTLKLFPVGVALNIYTKVALRGNTILGGALSLLVEVNITADARLVQGRTGAPRLLLHNCRTNLGGIRILSGLLPFSLDKVLSGLLNKVVPGLLCPVADVVLALLNTVLGTVNSVCPFGILGSLHYTLAGLPLFKGQQIVLNLNLMMTDLNGQTVDFPGAPNSSVPQLPAMDHTSQLMLPLNLLSSVIQTLVSKGGFNVDLTEVALGGSVPMTTSALRSVLPEDGEDGSYVGPDHRFQQAAMEDGVNFPQNSWPKELNRNWVNYFHTWKLSDLPQLGAEDLPLVVKIRVRELPLVSLQNGKVKIQLGAALQVLSHSNSTLTPLFTVEANISLSGSFSVTRTKLGVSLALERVSLNVSNVGSFDGNALKAWVTNILQIGYLPLINVGLNIGVPLPNIFNLNFADGVVKTLDDMLVISKTLK